MLHTICGIFQTAFWFDSLHLLHVGAKSALLRHFFAKMPSAGLRFGFGCGLGGRIFIWHHSPHKNPPKTLKIKDFRRVLFFVFHPLTIEKCSYIINLMVEKVVEAFLAPPMYM